MDRKCWINEGISVISEAGLECQSFRNFAWHEGHQKYQSMTHTWRPIIAKEIGLLKTLKKKSLLNAAFEKTITKMVTDFGTVSMPARTLDNVIFHMDLERTSDLATSIVALLASCRKLGLMAHCMMFYLQMFLVEGVALSEQGIEQVRNVRLQQAASLPYWKRLLKAEDIALWRYFAHCQFMLLKQMQEIQEHDAFDQINQFFGEAAGYWISTGMLISIMNPIFGHSYLGDYIDHAIFEFSWAFKFLLSCGNEEVTELIRSCEMSVKIGVPENTGFDGHARMSARVSGPYTSP